MSLSGASWTLVVLGAGTGVLSGLMGVGGGFLLVPALALLGWPMANAVGTSLAYVAVVGAGGAWAHWRAGNISPRFVIWVAVPAALCAPAGATLATRLPDAWLALAFAIFLAVMAFLMRQPRSAAEMSAGLAEEQRPTLRAVLLGAVVGLLSGIFGVGGGLLLVPAQVNWLGIPLKRAVGNSLGAVLLTGVSGTVGHFHLGTLEIEAAFLLIAGGLLGVAAGTRLIKQVSSERLRIFFWVFLLLLALATSWRGISVLVQ